MVMPRELKLYYNKRVEDWLVFAETNTVSIRCSTKDVYDEGDTRIDDIIDFIIKARPQTLITENYSISIFEKMQGSGSRTGVTKIIAVNSVDNSWAFKGDDHNEQS